MAETGELLQRRKRGRPRTGRGYQEKATGRWVASPLDDALRSYPTSWKSGQILRAHLVWNLAYPDDLVRPGDRIDHENGILEDDRIENLAKLTSAEYATKHSRGRKTPKRDRVCLQCDRAFKGPGQAKFCSTHCRSTARNQRALSARADARQETAHPCLACEDVVLGRARYCQKVTCQRVRIARKSQKWHSKPENAERLRANAKAKRAAFRAANPLPVKPPKPPKPPSRPKLSEDERRANRQRHRELRRERGKALIREAKGDRCWDCGSVLPSPKLHFHHRDPAEKDKSVSQMSALSFTRIKAEIAKCDVLCQRCHTKRHLLEKAE
jgi:hypothetical protein